MDTSDDRFDYAVAWIDCMSRGSSLGRAALLRANHASRDELPIKLRANPLAMPSKLPLSVPFTLPNFTVNPLSNNPLPWMLIS